MKKFGLYDILWIVVFSIGILLLVYMIIYEDEPGALPLAMILLGISGFLIRRSLKKKATTGN